AAGILHRDVKPSNVLLMDAERVTARVLDFGLAQMADADTLTEAGDVPGTLAYISPERLAGGEATPAADVWAVGVMLWEALAGRHPFWRGSMLETARAIEAGARPLGELRPDLPKRVPRLVDSALSTHPAGWLLVTWREPRATLLFVIGPLLAPIAALGLLPLVTARTRSAPLRVLAVALGVLTAALAAGIRHVALPLVGGAAPLGIGVT